MSTVKKFKTHLEKISSPGEIVSTDHLRSRYADFAGKSVSDANFRVIIHRLKKRGVITSVRRGWYEITSKKRIVPTPGELETKVYGTIKETFPFSEFVVWGSDFFDSFSSFQATRKRLFVEIETGSEEPVYNVLQDLYPGELFVTPDESVYHTYVSKAEHPIIIKPLISESPTETENNITVPAVEKIIVDLFAEELHFQPWLSERGRIVKELFERTTVNLSTLIRYASRRNRRTVLKSFLLENKLAKRELLEGL